MILNGTLYSPYEIFLVWKYDCMSLEGSCICKVMWLYLKVVMTDEP